jgi:DNA-binding NtrC family response regulator
VSRILLIDDDTNLSNVLAAFLRRNGHDVITPPHHRAIVDLIIAGEFDLVVTDILMPEMDGIEVFRAVKRHWPEKPVIAISGGSDRPSATAALHWFIAFGVDAILYKPFSQSELLSEVNEALEPAKK